MTGAINTMKRRLCCEWMATGPKLAVPVVSADLSKIQTQQMSPKQLERQAGEKTHQAEQSHPRVVVSRYKKKTNIVGPQARSSRCG